MTQEQMNISMEALIRHQTGFKETFIIAFDRQLKKATLFRESSNIQDEKMYNGRKRYKVIA